MANKLHAPILPAIALAVCFLLPSATMASIHVHKGNSTSSTAIYTLEDNGRLHKGNSTSGTTIYFFQNKHIYKGSSTSGTALYTIDNYNCLRKGPSTSGTALYKFDRNKIYKGASSSGTALYTLNGKYLHKGPSTSSTTKYTFDKQQDIPLELVFFIVAVVEQESETPEPGSMIRVYKGQFASGAATYTLKDNHLFKGQFTSGESFYTFKDNELYEGNYASGAADFNYDQNGRLYKGQFASGKASFIYKNNHIYRGHYASGAADFTINGKYFYRGQYASGAATYTIVSDNQPIPLNLLFFLVAVVEPKPDAPLVKTEDTDIQLAENEQALIRQMAKDLTGTSFDAIVARGDEEDIRACLALGVLPHMTSQGMATFSKPSLQISDFDPTTGTLSVKARPGTGGSVRANYPMQAEALHIHAADSIEALGTGNTSALPVHYANAHGSGTATLHLALPNTKTLFLRISVEP